MLFRSSPCSNADIPEITAIHIAANVTMQSPAKLPIDPLKNIIDIQAKTINSFPKVPLLCLIGKTADVKPRHSIKTIFLIHLLNLHQ